MKDHTTIAKSFAKIKLHLSDSTHVLQLYSTVEHTYVGQALRGESVDDPSYWNEHRCVQSDAVESRDRERAVLCCGIERLVARTQIFGAPRQRPETQGVAQPS